VCVCCEECVYVVRRVCVVCVCCEECVDVVKSVRMLCIGVCVVRVILCVGCMMCV